MRQWKGHDEISLSEAAVFVTDISPLRHDLDTTGPKNRPRGGGGGGSFLPLFNLPNGPSPPALLFADKRLLHAAPLLSLPPSLLAPEA